MGNQAIAAPIVGDPTTSHNGLFYLYSDHLGSNSVMSYYKLDDGSNHTQIGQAVTGSLGRGSCRRGCGTAVFSPGDWSMGASIVGMYKKISRIQHNPLIPYRNEVYYVCVIGLFKV